MHEVLVKGSSLPEAYHLALLALDENHDITPCTDYNTTQKEAAITFVAENPLEEPGLEHSRPCQSLAHTFDNQPLSGL